MAAVSVVLIAGGLLFKFVKQKTASHRKHYHIQVVPTCDAECISEVDPSESKHLFEPVSPPWTSGEAQHFYCSRVDGCLVPPLSDQDRRVCCFTQSTPSCSSEATDATDTVHFYESMTHKNSSYGIRTSHDLCNDTSSGSGTSRMSVQPNCRTFDKP